MFRPSARVCVQHDADRIEFPIMFRECSEMQGAAYQSAV